MLDYGSVKLRRDVMVELRDLARDLTPPPPGHAPRLSDVVLVALQAYRKAAGVRRKVPAKPLPNPPSE